MLDIFYKDLEIKESDYHPLPIRLFDTSRFVMLYKPVPGVKHYLQYLDIESQKNIYEIYGRTFKTRFSQIGESRYWLLLVKKI